MDDILAIASTLVENENYKKDDYLDVKPDGEYTTILEKVEVKMSEEKGTEWFSFIFNIVEGEYANQKLFVNLFLTEKTTKGTLSKIMNLISSLGYEIDLTMFESKDAIEKGLQNVIGTEILVNKKTSANGYVNYSMRGTEE